MDHFLPRGPYVSIGGLLALVVLVLVVVALVFKSATPDWLELVLIGVLALAVLLAGWPLRRTAAG